MIHETPSSQRPHISVFGLGYVGCVTAASLARLGHHVIGVDQDAFKVECVASGRAPFFEPGLGELVAEGVTAGRLAVARSAAEALASTSIAMICVGTPPRHDGDLDLQALERVTGEIADVLRQRPGRPMVIVVRSTVFPGTSERVVIPRVAPLGATVVVHPEFMREGSALRDFMEPGLLVVGSDDEGARRCVAALYRALRVTPCLVSLRAAEMVKYACNAFHAVKIDFANEIAALSARLGIPGSEITDMLCLDTRLNISSAYLRPGFAFGGSCLPKDLRALMHHAQRNRLQLPLLESVLQSNQRHLERAVETVLDLPARRLGVFGLAYKENTDDLRESPSVALLKALFAAGRNVRIFDPHISLDRIYGANERYALAALPMLADVLDRRLDVMLEWAEHVVLLQRPNGRDRDIIEASGVPVLDLQSAPAAAFDPAGVE